MSEAKKDSWPLHKKLYWFGVPFVIYLTIKNKMWNGEDWLLATGLIVGTFMLAAMLDLIDEHKRERARMNAAGEPGITGLETLGLYFLVRLIFNFQAVICFVIAFIMTVVWFFFYR